MLASDISFKYFTSIKLILLSKSRLKLFNLNCIDLIKKIFIVKI